MNCNYKFYIGRHDILGNKIQVPCGRCVQCRLRQQKFLCDRMYVSWQTHSCAAFVTFTYDDSHLPLSPESGLPTLSKSDIRDYLDNIKHQLSVDYEYYVAGEYGDRFGRPHYHAIFFGLDYQFHAKFFKDSWHFGSVKVLPVTSKCFRYVSKYVVEGQSDKSRKYFLSGIQKPFHSMSRALGIKPLLPYLDDYSLKGYIVFCGRRISLPRYYYNKLVHYSRKTLVDVEQRYYNTHRAVRSESSKYGMKENFYTVYNSDLNEKKLVAKSINTQLSDNS